MVILAIHCTEIFPGVFCLTLARDGYPIDPNVADKHLLLQLLPNACSLLNIHPGVLRSKTRGLGQIEGSHGMHTDHDIT